MRRTVLIVALLLAGCSKPANEANVQNEGKAEDVVSVSAPKARVAALVDQCNRIAVEREILSAKYNALIDAHHLDTESDKFVIDRCSDTDPPAEPKESKREAREAEGEVRQRNMKQAEAQPVELCWEGYCPCDPPQGGPDQLLCDQIRMGKVDPGMLSVGKSMREVRRQVAETEF